MIPAPVKLLRILNGLVIMVSQLAAYNTQVARIILTFTTRLIVLD